MMQVNEIARKWLKRRQFNSQNRWFGRRGQEKIWRWRWECDIEKQKSNFKFEIENKAKKIWNTTTTTATTADWQTREANQTMEFVNAHVCVSVFACVHDFSLLHHTHIRHITLAHVGLKFIPFEKIYCKRERKKRYISFNCYFTNIDKMCGHASLLVRDDFSALARCVCDVRVCVCMQTKARSNANTLSHTRRKLKKSENEMI